MKDEFSNQGYAIIRNLVQPEEIEKLLLIYDKLLQDKSATKGLRSDLAGTDFDERPVERITQIMRPSLVEPKLAEMEVYHKALHKAKELLGSDVEFDFDMLINKAPMTNTETPWHQDAAYWIKMPDLRAVSFWIALDDVDIDNGCMWFLPVSGRAVFPHEPSGKGGALTCAKSIVEKPNAAPIPLKTGDCTIHDGFTLHYSGGNKTNRQRRALILNFRPLSMIELERSQGMDHTGDIKVRQ